MLRLDVFKLTEKKWFSELNNKAWGVNVILLENVEIQ